MQKSKIQKMKPLILLVSLILLSHGVASHPYLPPNIPVIIRGHSTLLAEFGKIVDGAGYSLHNTAFSLDLVCHFFHTIFHAHHNHNTIKYFSK